MKRLRREYDVLNQYIFFSFYSCVKTTLRKPHIFFEQIGVMYYIQSVQIVTVQQRWAGVSLTLSAALHP